MQRDLSPHHTLYCLLHDWVIFEKFLNVFEPYVPYLLNTNMPVYFTGSPRAFQVYGTVPGTEQVRQRRWFPAFLPFDSQQILDMTLLFFPHVKHEQNWKN